jgi:DNA invertase Pin-like site-specific DNA recombinase
MTKSGGVPSSTSRPWNPTRANPETHFRRLREYAAHRGVQIVGEYIDYASGRSTERTGYKALIEIVRKRQVDVVLVFHYDRLARFTIELITRVEEFRRHGVDFMSYQQKGAFPSFRLGFQQSQM